MNNTRNEQEDMQLGESEEPTGEASSQILESVESLLQCIRRDLTPRDDLRREWNKKKAEQDQLLKQ